MSKECVLNVKNFIKRSGELEPSLHAFTSINSSQILNEAEELDKLKPSQRGALHGLLVAVKEVYDVAGYNCGWGTPIHNKRVPQRDAAMVSQLRAAGAIIAGITVSTEYAISTTGPTTNPHDQERTPGASSQGSAAAVAAGLVPAALGSQTIGSVIRPAAYCGCLGFKPSWGLFDVSGSMSLSKSIDHAGLFTRDIKTMLELANILQPKYDWLENYSLKSKAIMIEPWYEEKTDSSVINTLNEVEKKLRHLNFTVDKITLPSEIVKHEEELVTTLLTAGMAHNHIGDFNQAKDQMSKRVCEFITAGIKVSKEKYESALNEQKHIATMLDKMFSDTVFITASTTGIAPLKQHGTGSRAPQRLWTLGGLPTLTIPYSTDKGLPVGVQIGASRGADQATFAMAQMLMGSIIPN